MDNEIFAGEADLILEKLYSESIPVVAYYMRDGVKVLRHGVITGVADEPGLTVADKGSGHVLYDYLAVSVGSPPGTGCTFWYGDVRELPDEKRTEVSEKLGDAVLLISCPNGGQLWLYFSM